MKRLAYPWRRWADYLTVALAGNSENKIAFPNRQISGHESFELTWGDVSPSDRNLDSAGSYFGGGCLGGLSVKSPWKSGTNLRHPFFVAIFPTDLVGSVASSVVCRARRRTRCTNSGEKNICANRYVQATVAILVMIMTFWYWYYKILKFVCFLH